jgi:hypothetical protein
VRVFYLAALSGAVLLAQSRGEEVFLVKLKRAPGLTTDNVLDPSWEEKRVKVRLPNSDWEEEFENPTHDEEDTPISQCFVPQIKLITQRYTFVISLGCGNLITFQNKAPFTPAPNRIQNPFEFSDELRYFIEKITEKHLKIPPRRLYAEYALSYTPPPPDISYEDLDFLIGQSQIVIEEDDEPDDDIPSPSESPADWLAPDEDEDADD